MLANGGWDLIQRLKGKTTLKYVIMQNEVKINQQLRHKLQLIKLKIDFTGKYGARANFGLIECRKYKLLLKLKKEQRSIGIGGLNACLGTQKDELQYKIFGHKQEKETLSDQEGDGQFEAGTVH